MAFDKPSNSSFSNKMFAGFLNGKINKSPLNNAVQNTFQDNQFIKTGIRLAIEF